MVEEGYIEKIAALQRELREVQQMHRHLQEEKGKYKSQGLNVGRELAGMDGKIKENHEA